MPGGEPPAAGGFGCGFRERCHAERSWNDFDCRMNDLAIQCGEFETFLSGEFRQVMVGHFLTLARMGLERRQTDGFGLCADSQESKLRERASRQILASHPAIGFRMIDVILPGCSD